MQQIHDKKKILYTNSNATIYQRESIPLCNNCNLIVIPSKCVCIIMLCTLSYVPPYYAQKGWNFLTRKVSVFFVCVLKKINSMPIFHNPLKRLPFGLILIFFLRLTIHFFCYNYWCRSFVRMYIILQFHFSFLFSFIF